MRVLEEDLCGKGAFNQNSESCESITSGRMGCRGTGGSVGRGNSNCSALGPGKGPGCLRNNVRGASVAGEQERDPSLRHTAAALSAVLRSEPGGDLTFRLEGSPGSYLQNGAQRSKNGSRKARLQHPGEDCETEGGIPHGCHACTSLGLKRAGQKKRRQGVEAAHVSS